MFETAVGKGHSTGYGDGLSNGVGESKDIIGGF
ncbi:hypothetical protein LUCX_12 [Xanthomonas phage vB_XciM_LucasX]|nr:hypothetical protein LUCX_12 [Xanthomonas phage vB_XciM_LucasX]